MEEEDWGLIGATALRGEASRSSIAQAAQFSQPNCLKHSRIAPSISSSSIGPSLTCQGSLQEAGAGNRIKRPDQLSSEEDTEDASEFAPESSSDVNSRRDTKRPAKVVGRSGAQTRGARKKEQPAKVVGRSGAQTRGARKKEQPAKAIESGNLGESLGSLVLNRY
jgi:hypothetical protein